jgi:hypothetical protein
VCRCCSPPLLASPCKRDRAPPPAPPHRRLTKHPPTPKTRGSHLNGGEEHDFAQAYFFDVARSRDPETDPSYGSLVGAAGQRPMRTAAAAAA